MKKIYTALLILGINIPFISFASSDKNNSASESVESEDFKTEHSHSVFISKEFLTTRNHYAHTFHVKQPTKNGLKRLSVNIFFRNIPLFNGEKDTLNIIFDGQTAKIIMDSNSINYEVEEDWIKDQKVFFTLNGTRKQSIELVNSLDVQLYLRNGQPAAVVADQNFDKDRTGSLWVEITLYKRRGIYPLKWVSKMASKRLKLESNGQFPQKIIFDELNATSGSYFIEYRAVRYNEQNQAPIQRSNQLQTRDFSF